MGQNSKIEWCHHTLNPWRGCTKATWTDAAGKTRLHPGCLNCYAEVDYSVKMHGIRWGKGQDRRPKADSGWAEPMRWGRAAAKAGERHRVFCASLADVLDPEVPDSMRERLWPIIEDTAWMCGGCGRPCAHSSDTVHRKVRLQELDSVGAACEGKNGRCLTTPMGGLDFLLLTKRPEEWQRIPTWVRPLAWLGTSVSDQETADEWVVRLLQAHGFRYRFLSVEPMVGPVDLSRVGTTTRGADRDALRGWSTRYGHKPRNESECAINVSSVRDFVPIDWVIVGGESGPKARPCHVEWIRSIVRQCVAAGVPCHVKQLGAAYSDPADGIAGASLRIPDEAAPLLRTRLSDPKGGDWNEWPEDLRVREFPAT